MPEVIVAEEWRPVPGFEKYYEASNMGRVKSLARPMRRKTGGWKRERLIGNSGKQKYKKIVITNGDPRDTQRTSVHALVALAFIGPRPAGAEVHHINSNPSDNRAVNLSYQTQSEHRKIHVAASPLTMRGSGWCASKLTEDQVRSIRSDASSHADVAKRYGVHPAHVRSIRNKRKWAWLT